MGLAANNFSMQPFFRDGGVRLPRSDLHFLHLVLMSRELQQILGNVLKVLTIEMKLTESGH
jgi:hypothetical protein